MKEFHDAFGNIEWIDEDKIKKQIADLPDIVSTDEGYRNAMKNSDKQNTHTESDRVVTEAILRTISIGVKLYREVQNNDYFRKWILDIVFNATYQPNQGNRPSV